MLEATRLFGHGFHVDLEHIAQQALGEPIAAHDRFGDRFAGRGHADVRPGGLDEAPGQELGQHLARGGFTRLRRARFELGPALGTVLAQDPDQLEELFDALLHRTLVHGITGGRVGGRIRPRAIR